MAGRVNHPQQPPAASQISVASVYRSQGATLESEGRFDEALDAYEKAVRQENSRLATLDKGRVLDKMGYQVAAAETYIDFASSSLD
jgi:tetratricopeptide (TPR) repeat protein